MFKSADFLISRTQFEGGFRRNALQIQLHPEVGAFIVASDFLIPPEFALAQPEHPSRNPNRNRNLNRQEPLRSFVF